MKTNKLLTFVLGILLLSSLVFAKDFLVQNSSNSNQNYFAVNGTSGNVGIGTTSPSTVLDVHAATSGGGIAVEDRLSNEVARLRAGNNYGYLDLYSTGSNTVRIISNGNSYFNGGNVGIGTTNPKNELQVGYIGIVNPNIYSNLYYDGGFKFIDNGYGTILSMDAGSSGAFGFYTTENNTGGADNSVSSLYERVRITNDGNVGIGTTNPGYDLEVAGSLDADAISINGVPVGTSSDTYWNAGTGGIYYGSNVGIGTSSPTGKLVVNQSSGTDYFRLARANHVTWGISNSYNGVDDTLYFTTGSVAPLSLTETGNVGIGTSSPAQELDVNGSVNVAEDYAYYYGGVPAFRLANGTDSYYANVIIGQEAGNESSEKQTVVGYQAGRQSIGDYQTAIGYQAGYQNTGDYQTATGYDAGYQNTGGYQTALGREAGRENTGYAQTVLGYNSGRYNSGAQQVSIGYQAGYNNTGGSQIAIGTNAGYQNKRNSQIAIGTNAGYQNTGDYQTAIGDYAGIYNTQDHQTAVGRNAGWNNTGLYQTAIGASAGYNNSAIYQTVVGGDAGSQNIGTYQIALGIMSGSQNIASYQTAIGYYAGYNNSGTSQISIGYQAGHQNTGIYQTALGYRAGHNNSGDYVVALGRNAGRDNSGDSVVALGYDAGYQNIGDYQTAVGRNAGYNNSGGQQTSLGFGAGYGNSGGDQTAIGDNAGSINSGGSQIALGIMSGSQNIASYQTAIGYYAGYNNSGTSQISIGYQAGYQNTGTYQTVLGYRAGYNNSGDSVVALGREAGKDNTQDYQFIVRQANVNSIPLIQGDFASGNVGIGTTTPNSKLEVNGSVNITSGALYFPDGTSMSTASVGGGDSIWTNSSGNATFTTGNVGIGTASPSYKLEVNGSLDADAISINGVPIGTSSDSYWNNNSGDIYYSSGNVGIGTNNPSVMLDVEVSSGGAATIGSSSNSATGDYAIAMGYSTQALGDRSTAIGSSTTASGYASTAIGVYTTASGYQSTAMGYYTTASGSFSTAMGREINVSGSHSFGISLNDPASDYQLSQSNTMAIMGGNVGIGTTTPNSKLEVNGSVNITSGALYFPDGTSMTTASAGGGDSIWTNSSGNATFTTGNVGIGTVSPEAKLHLNQGGNDYGDGFRLSNPDGENWEMVVDSVGNLKLGWNFSAPPVMKFNNNSNVGIGVIDPMEELHIDGIDSDVAMLLTTLNSGNTANDGFYVGISAVDDEVSLINRENSNVVIGTNNTERMIITNDGKVGIGTVSPNSKLEVNGSISTAISSVSGDVTLDEGDSVVLINASSNNRTVNLPTASGATGRKYTIKKIDSSSNSVIIEGYSSETIDLELNLNITSQFVSYDIISDGSNWWVI